MKKNKYELMIFGTKKELFASAAEVISEIAEIAVADRGKFIIALSGGQTPSELYALLAGPLFRDRINREKVFIFWGDERCVPQDDERNNAGRAISIWLDKINIPPAHIFPVDVSLPPVEAAADYEKKIKAFFGDQEPQFDLILLGLGENGHTASIFPYTDITRDQHKGVRAFYLEEEKIFRITMTAPLINCARNILFLVTGKNKAGILEKILEGQSIPEKYPARLIRPVDGNLYWFTDSDAAGMLKTHD